MASKGLTSAEVARLAAEGKSNVNVSPKTKSYTSIVLSNIFTFFNLVNIAVAVLILSTGVTFDTLKNTFFLLVVISNATLGIFQQARAKATMDKLQIISSLKACVIRDGVEQTISTEEVVLGDLVVLKAGNQVVADLTVTEGGVDVDESILTGESEPVHKTAGDTIFAGSYIISGVCEATVTAVSGDCYSATITKSAKRLRKNTSEIMKTLQWIIKVMTIVNVPLGAALFFIKLYVQHLSYADTVLSIGGSVIGMLPEGLILLTTTVFTVTAMKLGLKRVLAQDMYSAESLARVDVLCLDKTGTLTTGDLQVDEVIPLSDADVPAIMAAFLKASTDENATARGLRAYFGTQSDKKARQFYPFDSTKKLSAATFADGTYLVGAPDYILQGDAHRSVLEEKSKTARVLVLALFQEDVITPLAFITLKDTLRANARQTLQYFAEQDVTVKVISGDNIHTVRTIAEQSGVLHFDRAIDMSTVSDEQLADVAEQYTVFARVTPEQKKQLVLALKANGHHVAMTGDGVNDVMALREADCSIAMAQGADAAKNVSQLVLLDSNFDALPLVVKEGRRSINNLKRSASLFLVKTLFSLFLTVLFLFIPYAYPFEPIQLTLVSALCIGTPSVLLALEPNFSRIQGRFLADILVRSLPAALAYVAGVCLCTAVGAHYGIVDEISTMCVIVAGSASFINLARVCMPFNWFRGSLFVVMLAGFVLGNIFLKPVFSLVPLTGGQYLLCAMLIAAVCVVYFITYFITEVIAKKINKKTD